MSDPSANTGLDHGQLASFEKDGFVVVDHLLDDNDLLPLEVEYEQLLDDLARHFWEEGKIPSAFEQLSFGERFARILEDVPDLHVHFNISLPLSNGEIDADSFFVHTGPAVFSLLRNRKILDAVESIIGPEIYSSPVQQMRMKPPETKLDCASVVHSNVGKTVWHQDIAAVLAEADNTKQVTVWVALSDATEQNGCLVSVPGSHRLGPQIHCSDKELSSERGVPLSIVGNMEKKPLPVGRGGIVLFHKMNLHAALPNRSSGLRWSADLRYHPIGQATGRPAFPGFVARSRANPESELRDASAWARSWAEARRYILDGKYRGRMFEDERWGDAAVC